MYLCVQFVSFYYFSIVFEVFFFLSQNVNKYLSAIRYVIGDVSTILLTSRDRHGRSCMVSRFTTTYTISAYHH
jgi:hypothetical protein